jgi:hypothetical protein
VRASNKVDFDTKCPTPAQVASKNTVPNGISDQIQTQNISDFDQISQIRGQWQKANWSYAQ